MPATVSHALSMTTPDDPAYENQPKHWNSNHAFTLNASGSEISGAFSNAVGGVSFGLDGGGYVTASAPAAAPSPINFSAGTTSGDLGSVVFSNSNGVSFGLNGSTITGSHNGLTTAMASNRGSDFVQATAAFAGTSASGTIASNGISVSIGPYITTAMLSNAATISNIKVSAGTSSTNLSALTFDNSNGISFGLNGSVITGSHNALTSQSNQAVSNSAGSFTFQTLNFSDANNVTFGTSAGGIVTASVANPSGITNIKLSAGTSSANLSDVTFSNSNNISFGLNGSTVTGSVAAPVTLSNYPDRFSLSVQSLDSGTSGGTGGSTQLTVSLRIGQMQIPQNLSWTRAGIEGSFATVAGTGSASFGYCVGIYSLNAGTAFSLMPNLSSQMVMILSQNSVTVRSNQWWWGTNSTSNSSGNTAASANNSASFTGPRYLLLDTVGSTLSPGEYYAVWGLTARTGNSNIFASNSLFGNGLSVNGVSISLGDNVTPAGPGLMFGWQGNISTTTNNSNTGMGFLPSSIHTSAFTLALNNGLIPQIFLDGRKSA